jgi:hypothetical protein
MTFNQINRKLYRSIILVKYTDQWFHIIILFNCWLSNSKKPYSNLVPHENDSDHILIPNNHHLFQGRLYDKVV